MIRRCAWCGDDPLYVAYHDKEWGVPVRDDQTLFEFLVLEGAQAGLSWITILRKREGYRELFDNFDAAKIARYSDRKLDKLLLNPRIIRNRLKVYGARKNARAFLDVQQERGSFSDYIWDFVDSQPIQNRWRSLRDVPATSTVSDCNEQGHEEARLHFRRIYHHVRPHAGHRYGKRPHRRLFSPWRVPAIGVSHLSLPSTGKNKLVNLREIDLSLSLAC